MRLASRIARPDGNVYVLPVRSTTSDRHENKEDLTAFRGFLFAASVSLLLWGIGLSVIWLMLWR